MKSKKYKAMATLLIIIGFCIAMFSSENILDKYKIIGEFTATLKTIFPPIAGYANRSKFPQISELYFSYALIISPYFFWINVKIFTEGDDFANLKAKTGFDRLRLLFICLILFPALSYFVLFINPGYDFNLLPVNSSRFSLAASGFIFSASGAAYMLAGAYCILLKLIGLYRNDK